MNDLFNALALVLVIEGIMPFVMPHVWKQSMQQASQLTDNILRFVGLGSMLLGVLTLYLLH